MGVHRPGRHIPSYEKEQAELRSRLGVSCPSRARGEQAVSIGRLTLKGRSSGAVTEVTGAAAWSMRDERLLRMAYHPTVQDARRELGWDS